MGLKRVFNHNTFEDGYELKELNCTFVARSHNKKPTGNRSFGKAETLYNQGVRLLKRGNAHKAVIVLKKAVELDSESMQIRVTLANALFEAKDEKEALRLYEELLELDSTNAMLHLQYARLLGRINKKHEMIYELEAAAKLAPNDPIICDVRASTLYSNGYKDRAVVVWKEGIDIHSTDARLYYSLGVALVDLGRFEEAKHHLEEARLFNQGNPDILKKLEQLKNIVTGARAYASIDSFKEIDSTIFEDRALADIRKSIDSAVDIKMSLLREGRKLVWSNRPIDAIILLEPASKKYSGNIELRFVLGKAYFAVRRYQNAIEQFQKVLRLDPYHKEAKRLLKKVQIAKEATLEKPDMTPKIPVK